MIYRHQDWRRVEFAVAGLGMILYLFLRFRK